MCREMATTNTNKTDQNGVTIWSYGLFGVTFHDSELMRRHYGRDGVSNHQPHDCLLNGSFSRRSKKTSKLHVTGLCAGNSPVTGEFPAQKLSNAENVSIWWRHHVKRKKPELWGRWTSLSHLVPYLVSLMEPSASTIIDLSLRLSIYTSCVDPPGLCHSRKILTFPPLDVSNAW